MLKTPGMRALGLDVGSKTIGVAVSDPSGTIASPRQVLARRGHAEDAAAVAALARDLEAGAVVVGLPLELDGSVGHRARQVQRFLAALEPALSALEATGLTRSDAIRASLIASATRLRRGRELAAEAAALEADESDRAEMLEVASLMEALRAAG